VRRGKEEISKKNKYKKSWEIFLKNYNNYDFSYKYNKIIMVEPLLSGIVLGLVPVTIAGLFVTAYLQYRRGDLANF
jgi:cytochrome b6-f complex subunit 5